MPKSAIAGWWLALLAVLVLFGCDSNEDPNLLNPPIPDSTLVRVVNLTGEPIDAMLRVTPLATALAPGLISNYQRFLFTGQADLVVRRPGRSDTLRNQSLTKSARITYFVLAPPDTTLMISRQVSTEEETDLMNENEARLVFINAISDSLPYLIRTGCQSGDTLFNSSISFADARSINFEPTELSVYLFRQGESSVASSAHLTLAKGTVTFLVAAKIDGQPRLYLVPTSATAVTGPLPEAPPETRTQASLQLLNALIGSSTISARITGSPSEIAHDLATLNISSATDLEACLNPGGDSLEVTPSGGAVANVPIRLNVGGRTVIAVYGSADAPKVVTLDRPMTSGAAGKTYVRGVNLSPDLGPASVTVGAGAPAGIERNARLFGTLRLGEKSEYTELNPGTYPLLLTQGGSGRVVAGGVQQFAPGHYTIAMVRRDSTYEMMILADEESGSTQLPAPEQGSNILLFSMMPGELARFVAGPLVIDSIAYGYVASTLIPRSVTTITSEAGQAAIDHAAQSYIVGATGTGSNRQMIAFPALSIDPPNAKRTFIRFLNAVPGSPELRAHIGTDPAVIATMPFGIPSPHVERDTRKYSFYITTPGDTVARIDGVEMVGGRRYLLVVGPRNPQSGQSNNGLEYEVLWMQE